jgi:hypothetical protein
LHTYPSWRPSRQLDHILLSRGLRTRKIEVLADRYSDHLPIVVELELPIGLALEVVTWDANHPVERGYVAN